jgi:hypothetical protein
MEKKPWEVVVAVLAVLFLCAWGGGCGSVTATTEQLAAPDAGAAGMNGGQSGMNGGQAGMNGAAGRMAGAGGATGAGGELGGRGGGTGGAPVDAGVDVVTCIPIDGGRYCDPNAQPCPAGVSLATCPKGTVKAGPNQSCPAGDRYVSLFDICIPTVDSGV